MAIVETDNFNVVYGSDQFVVKASTVFHSDTLGETNAIISVDALLAGIVRAIDEDEEFAQRLTDAINKLEAVLQGA